MNVVDEPVVVLTVLVVVSFSFLLCLPRGSLSEGEQTGVWVVFTVLFFSLCNLPVRSDTQRGNANHTVDTKQTSRSEKFQTDTLPTSA